MSAESIYAAVLQAAETYRYIERAKGKGTFLTEVSMDETDAPQQPVELLLILAALADAGVPLATIAPKFTGRFNKGVDYVGDPRVFARELEQDMAVIRYAIDAFGLPAELKLSLHSGSDKFSIYGAVHAAMTKLGTGLHLKTAGTTWLEEVIGLAESGGDALALVKEIYAEAYAHRDELCAPYAAVIDIEPASLPTPAAAQALDGRAVGRRAAPRSRVACVQQEPAAAYACRVQDRSEDGAALHCHAGAARRLRGGECHAQFVRSSYSAGVSRRQSSRRQVVKRHMCTKAVRH